MCVVMSLCAVPYSLCKQLVLPIQKVPMTQIKPINPTPAAALQSWVTGNIIHERLALSTALRALHQVWNRWYCAEITPCFTVILVIILMSHLIFLPLFTYWFVFIIGVYAQFGFWPSSSPPLRVFCWPPLPASSHPSSPSCLSKHATRVNVCGHFMSHGSHKQTNKQKNLCAAGEVATFLTN